MLATFIGCAGVGKNTIINELLTRYPDVFGTFQTLTTRGMRTGESQGKPYYFLKTEQEFWDKVNSGEIYEYNTVHGHLYGGSREILRNALESGKILVKDIDVQGAASYREKLSDLTKILSVFIYVENLEVLKQRMRGRGDKEEDIEKRCKRFKMEMQLSRDSAYMVSNETLSDAVDAVNALLRAEAGGNPVYRFAKKVSKPKEENIRKYEEKLKAGKRLAAVELVFNGQELLVLNGAERYLAAQRTGCFIQKKIKRPTDRALASQEAGK